MKKKLIFINDQFKNEFYITIYKDRIINYYGKSFSRFFPENREKAKEFSINTSFKSYHLDKHHRKEGKIKANCCLRNENLEFILGRGVRINVRLNFFERVYINWFQKKYIIQSKEIKTDIVKYIIGGILGFIGAYAVQKISEINSSNENSLKMEIKDSQNKVEELTSYKNDTIELTNKR